MNMYGNLWSYTYLNCINEVLLVIWLLFMNFFVEVGSINSIGMYTSYTILGCLQFTHVKDSS